MLNFSQRECLGSFCVDLNHFLRLFYLHINCLTLNFIHRGLALQVDFEISRTQFVGKCIRQNSSNRTFRIIAKPGFSVRSLRNVKEPAAQTWKKGRFGSIAKALS